MSGAQLSSAIRQIQWLFAAGTSTGLSDTQLLSHFKVRRDETAFAALVARHGPMVLSVCRGVVVDPRDAEDAFQATFLILARKAGDPWADGELGGWLHKVAYRIAVRARGDATRRRGHERRAAEAAVVAYTQIKGDDDLQTVIHDEIARLPPKFRFPIVLCYLEGLTHEQAAARLRCGEATLRRRLAGARERLRSRLTRRGFAPTAMVVGSALARQARAAVPVGCERETIRAAMRIAAGEAVATVVSARVARLSRGGLTLVTNGWKGTTLAMLSLMALAGLASGVGAGDEKKSAPISTANVRPPSARADHALQPLARPDQKVGESTKVDWPITLAESLRVAISKTAGVRVLACSAYNLPIEEAIAAASEGRRRDKKSRATGMVIAKIDADTSAWRFKTEVMALCRSVEQQYLNLGQALVQRGGAERAAKFGKDVLDRETAELAAGRGTGADVAEANQRSEQFNLDMFARASDVIAAERQFRQILGLPGADNRRIIPVTPILEARFDPEWETCLRQMMDNQPEIVLIKRAIGERTAPTSEKAEANTIESENEVLRQAVEQRTRSLKRCFNEIGANYKLFEKAARLRDAATQRLDAQRENYQEGRITIDRFLDAGAQYYTAVVTEAQYKTAYNVAIVNLEEAKGTLLTFDNITVADQPDRQGTVNATAGTDQDARPVAVSTIPRIRPPSDPATDSRLPALPASGTVNAADAGGASHQAALAGQTTPRTWNFSFSIGRERPLVIKGTISEQPNDQSGPAAH
jgi:RNA polymerase sigma factor (sigma-70 family)